MKNFRILFTLLLVATLFAPGCADGFLSSSSTESERVTTSGTTSSTYDQNDLACHNLWEEDADGQRTWDEDERIDRQDCPQ